MNELFIISEMDELQKILCAINERLQIVAMSVADSKKQVHNSPKIESVVRHNCSTCTALENRCALCKGLALEAVVEKFTYTKTDEICPVCGEKVISCMVERRVCETDNCTFNYQQD